MARGANDRGGGAIQKLFGSGTVFSHPCRTSDRRGGSVVTSFQERGPNAYFHPIFTSLVGQKLIIGLRRGAMAPFGPYAATPMYM